MLVGALQQVGEAEFQGEVLQATVPVVVDFFAVWCGPCRLIAPALEDLSQTYAGKVKFVKVDIEGMELPALQGMAGTIERHRPDLYLEMHGATIAHKEANVTAIVHFLCERGYPSILHVESGESISPANATLAREGHLFASFSRGISQTRAGSRAR